MGNSMACISPGGKTSGGRGRTIKELEHSDRSFRNLQTLRRKSRLRSYYKAKSRNLQSTLVNKIVPVNIFWPPEDQNGDRTENGGITRVKMVLTRKEVAELLSKLRNSGGRGGVTAEDLGEVTNEGSGRIGWSPSLQSIPESDNVPDE
ncbi:hypothetical protein KSP40_PGU021800 [Platanthera guangdongensis]|uniref:Uncharacterized protein n=1 Tax=Platanthera guangdongensis TaxID=2320717 RepID=A0ABR2N1N9_9ASPA